MDAEHKAKKALDAAVYAQSNGVLPPIKDSCPPPARAMKGDWLEIVDLDDPSPPPPVPPEKTSEPTLDLLSESLEALFNARLLGSETPELHGLKELLATSEQEPEEGQAQVEGVSSAANRQSRSSTAVEEATLSRDVKDSEVLTVPPTFIRKTAEELVKCLESSFNVEVPVIFLYERLVDHLMEELETLSRIRITHQVLGGRLFSDENEAISHVVDEAHKSLLDKCLMKGASREIQWTVSYVADAILIAFVDYTLGCFSVSSSSPDMAEETSQGLGLPEVQYSGANESKRRCESATSRKLSTSTCSTIFSKPSPSEFEDLSRECGGSPDLSDLSDECSEIFTSYQDYQRYGHVKRPCTYLVKPAESPLEDSPDLSSSIPAVQVTEASENLVENNEDLETPACPNSTEDASTSRKTKKLRTRISNFLRRVFCFGCIPSRHKEPL